MEKWEDIRYIDNSLWNTDGILKRSSELTPLFIKRYKGPRMNKCKDSHLFWEFLCIIFGLGTFIANEKYILQPNVIYLIPPNIEHCEFTKKELDTIWIGVSGSKLPKFGSNILSIESEVITKNILNLWHFSKQINSCIGAELDGMLAVITGAFFRHLTAKNKNESLSIMRTVKYLQEKFSEHINFDNLADESGYSKGHFYRLFKKLRSKDCFLTTNIDKLTRINF